MSGQQSTDPTQGGTVTDPAQTVAKGKGKAVDEPPLDMSMDEDEDSSDEETGAEEEVSVFTPGRKAVQLTTRFIPGART